MHESYQRIYNKIPDYLHQFIVDQNYERYTPQDQAVWRYIMRKNLDYLSRHAHPAYIDGLAKTGIRTNKIPDIDEMNQQLQKIGWGAVVVDGFIPPAAFMEFQKYKILVISADLRTIGHILYTPAPDIVHEAAGHAPIIADEEYAEYLQKFGEYGLKAMTTKKDNEVYEAIRYLSIIKEYPNATPEQVKEAEEILQQKINENKDVSEAQKLSRLHWWTVEYGLYGTPENYLLYGAGLLSSVGESQACRSPKVKKIPLTVDCVNYDYDITSMQPQLFVNESWQQLTDVLEQFADAMCFRVGGMESLKTARDSKVINTMVYSSGLQVSGLLEKVLTGPDGHESYIATSGQSALALENHEIPGHGRSYYQDGFGSPVGKLRSYNKPLENFSDSDLNTAGIYFNKESFLEFDSGIKVTGRLKTLKRHKGKIVIMTFSECEVTSKRGELLFNKNEGEYNMAVGEKIISVFSGTADREKFRLLQQKSDKVAIEVEHSDSEKELFKLYHEVRLMRENDGKDPNKLRDIYQNLKTDYRDEWLLRLELLELSRKGKELKAMSTEIEDDLYKLRDKSEEYRMLIDSGIKLMEA